MSFRFRRFSSLIKPPYKQGFLATLKRKFFSRSVIHRILLIGTVTSTALSIYLMSKGNSRKEEVKGGRYIQPAEVLEQGANLDMSQTYLIGIVKPGSIKIVSGTNKHTFVITDFIHEITINYEGVLPNNFHEGETARIQGIFVDQYNPISFIADGIQAAHDAETPKTYYQPRSQDIAAPLRKL